MFFPLGLSNFLGGTWFPFDEGQFNRKLGGTTVMYFFAFEDNFTVSVEKCTQSITGNVGISHQNLDISETSIDFGSIQRTEMLIQSEALNVLCKRQWLASNTRNILIFLVPIISINFPKVCSV